MTALAAIMPRIGLTAPADHLSGPHWSGTDAVFGLIAQHFQEVARDRLEDLDLAR